MCMIIVLLPTAALLAAAHARQEEFRADCNNLGGHVFVSYTESSRLCLTADGRVIEIS